MDILSAEQDSLDMELTMIGAKVTSINGLLCFVHYHVNDSELFYVYNVNAKSQYYLQRVLPYPMGAGIFKTPEEIIDYIKNDIKQFENASNSKNFDSFIELSTKLHQTLSEFEDVFMNYNVPADNMQQIYEDLEHLAKHLNDIKSISNKIILK